jgi:predicted dithiol-disulfide oxidoreductase (DUF899 family)
MPHEIVTREEWLKRRIPLLEQEKALTRHRDLVAAERLRLPWVRLEKDYVFDGPDGRLSLSDLFQGRSQLYIKHFMMGPNAQHQCVGCSLEVDHMTDLLPHLENHDVSYAVVARAPIGEIEIVRKRMGWQFLWVSSFNNDFNYDFHVSFKPEEVAAGHAEYNYGRAQGWMANIQDLSGRSVFYRNEANMCSASTESLIQCRRGGTRPAPITRWATGRGRETCTARAAPLRAMAAIMRRLAAALRMTIERAGEWTSDGIIRPHPWGRRHGLVLASGGTTHSCGRARSCRGRSAW